jgi:LPXTG-motif cell wall-anchored protein
MPNRKCFALVAGLVMLPLIAHADPQSFKKPYYMDQIPIITGTVESVTDHSFDLVTDSGEHMTFEMDSQTLLPAKFGRESRVWIEYSLMENGAHRALRVSGLGTGTLATAENDANEHPQAEAATETPETYSQPSVAMQEPPPPPPLGGDTEKQPSRQLPKTASPWPLVQLLGAAAMSSGATLWFTRRRPRRPKEA